MRLPNLQPICIKLLGLKHRKGSEAVTDVTGHKFWGVVRCISVKAPRALRNQNPGHRQHCPEIGWGRVEDRI